MNTLTVLPILVALALGLALQPLHIYDIHARNLGTEKAEPWRSRSSGLAARVASLLSWISGLWRSRLFRLGAACAMAILIAHVSADAAPIGMAIVAEPSLADVKKAIEDSNRAFEEFKDTNAKRLKAIEDGKAVDPLIEAKLTRINEAIEKSSAVNEAYGQKLTAQAAAQEALGKELSDQKASINKLRVSGGGTEAEEKRAARVDIFNRSLKTHAQANGMPIPADVLAADVDAYCKAYDKYLRRGDRVLTPDESRALSVGTDPNGGWVVTPDLSGKIVTRVFETSPMRQYADSQLIGTDALEGASDLEEASFGWVGETGARTETNTPNVPAPWRIPVHEAYASPKATQKLVEDANIDIVAWLGKKVGGKIGLGFNTAFVTGNGVAKPRGFATYETVATADATRAWQKFEHIASGTNGSFGTDPNGANKLLDVIHALKDVYATNAAWYLNRTTLGAARKLTDAATAGHYLFIPSFVAGMPDTFLGYPVRKLQDMATYTTTDALAVAFGDMKETYLIVDRLGITVLVDPYTAKPYIVYYSRARVGGDVLNFDAMKFLKFGTS